jgi:opacity protein-like surface antigen
MRSIQVTMCLAAALTIAAASSAEAVTRRSAPPLLWHRTAVSGYVGYGIPVGEFADERPGYGNHESGALDWAAEIENFVGHTTSIGFSFANATYHDEDVDSLDTQLMTLSGFVRIVVPTATPIRPYLRFGMGGVQVEFLDPLTREDSDWEFSVQAGGGFLWLPERWLGINLQALYYWGDTGDSVLFSTADEIFVVGFDTSYWTFGAGLSLLFP